jgi:RNA polymerase sigma-70 factor (ECF subfamily)
MTLDSKTIVLVLMQQREKLFAYIWSIVGNVHLAEDVFQEVSLLATERGAEVADEGRLRAWLHTAARLKSLEALRATSRSPATFDESVLDILDPHWQSHADTEADETLEDLKTCLQLLTPRGRNALKLRYADNLKSGEIARRLGLKSATVYQFLSRVHRSLMDCIQKQRQARSR